MLPVHVDWNTVLTAGLLAVLTWIGKQLRDLVKGFRTYKEEHDILWEAHAKEQGWGWRRPLQTLQFARINGSDPLRTVRARAKSAGNSE